MKTNKKKIIILVSSGIACRYRIELFSQFAGKPEEDDMTIPTSVLQRRQRSYES